MSIICRYVSGKPSPRPTRHMLYSIHRSFKSRSETCDYISRNLDGIQQHAHREHGWRKRPKQTTFWTFVQVQTFFTGGGHIKYFTVREEADPLSAIAPSQSDPSLLDPDNLDVMEAEEERRLLEAEEYGPALDDELEHDFNTDWLRGCGWPKWLPEFVLAPRALRFGNSRVRWVCVMGEAEENDYVGFGYYAPDFQSSPVSRPDLAISVNDEVRFPDVCQWYTGSTHPPTTGSLFDRSVKTLGNSLDHMFFKPTQGRAEFSILCRTPWTRMMDPQLYTLHRLWFALVHQYSSRMLTYEEENLIAISGIAERVRSKALLTYLSGLWRQSLVLVNLSWTQLAMGLFG